MTTSHRTGSLVGEALPVPEVPPSQTPTGALPPTMSGSTPLDTKATNLGPGIETAGDTNNASTCNMDADSDRDTDSETESETDTSDNDEDEDVVDYPEPDIMIPTDGQRPAVWTMGLCSTLEKLVVKAKGAASKPVVKFIKKHLRGTKLIFVVGRSGTGKSLLLKELTGQDLVVGDTHKSGTKEYRVCPAVLDGEQYLFVDTVGFGVSRAEDMDGFLDIMSCMDALGPFVHIAGVLFFYNGNDIRLMGQELTTFQWIKCFCGPEFYRNITIVTSQWDILVESALKQRLECFARLCEEPVVADILDPPTANRQRYHAGATYYHGVTVDKANPGKPLRVLPKDTSADERAALARAMIKARYGNGNSNNTQVKLQIVHEMEQGIQWYETQAAKVLLNSHCRFELKVGNDGFVRATVVKDEEPRGLGANTPSAKARKTASKLALVPARLMLKDSEGSWNPKPEQRRSWYESLMGWLETAKKLAAFYREANAGLGAAARTEPTAWSRFAGRLHNWWSGSPTPGGGE